jgi:tRNA pseudouridine38-40 synthase
MAARLKLTLAYDGGSFAGWQSQTHGNTIHDHLERAFQCVTGKDVRIHGAGRTDAGVHALAQCAHVDLPNRKRSATGWQTAVNALLPPTIRVLRCRYVSADFHARFSATAKTYRYRIWSERILPPFELARAWHVRAPLDFEKLERCADHFVGTHDFGGFAANRGKPETNTVRTIHSIRTKKSGALITIEFKGDGFLYKMVRLMVGAIVSCVLGKADVQNIEQRLQSPHRIGSVRLVAPAAGLILVRVHY